MFDFSKPWPLGLNGRNWPVYLFVFALVLAVVVWADGHVSRVAIGWPEPVVGTFGILTDLGRSEWILIPSGVLALLCLLLAWLLPRRSLKLPLKQMAQVYAFVFAGVAIPGIFTAVVKRIVARARPELMDSAGAIAFSPGQFGNEWASWPSGHTTTALAFAFVVAFLQPRLFVPAVLLAVIVGFSRIPVGAHYPTDVLAGMVVGTLGAYAVRGYFAQRRWVFEVDPDGHIRPRKLGAVKRLLRPKKPQDAAR